MMNFVHKTTLYTGIKFFSPKTHEITLGSGAEPPDPLLYIADYGAPPCQPWICS